MEIFFVFWLFVLLITLSICAIITYKQNQIISNLTKELQYEKENNHVSEEAYRRQLAALQIDNKRIYENSIKTEKDLKQMYKQLKSTFDDTLKVEIQKAREDSLKKSRATMRGQATEHLAPLIATEWSSKDYRFVGNPIDYIVFDGASAVTDKHSDIVENVVLLEIKTGRSKLNKVQRRIRDAVKKGRVKFAIFNPDTNELKMEKNETK